MTYKILALDRAGNPFEWMTWERAVTAHAKGNVAWSISGGKEFTFNGGFSRMTGERSQITSCSIISIRNMDLGRLGNKLLKEHTLENEILFRRDRHLCAYCGTVYNDSHLTRDHINPVVQGGPDRWMNLVTACSGCNRRKAGRTPEQAGMPLLYLPYVPNRNEYLILQNRKILADQMEFLLAGVPNHSRLHEKK